MIGGEHNPVLYNTTDPTNPVGLPGGTPALTTLLYKVCDNDMEKFDEACRIISLFLDKKDELNAAPLKKLERLMGYVQNGTDGIISLFQDDATMNYGISHRAPGKAHNDWVMYGTSLKQSIDAAYENHGDDCE